MENEIIIDLDRSFDFFYIPRSPGRLTVCGIPSPFDVESPSPEPLNAIRFVADANVIAWDG